MIRSAQLSPRAVHTAMYMRENSMVLFTAVLAIASKFCLPQLYPRLLQNANDAIRTAILEPIYHIGVVQAICILVCSFASSPWMLYNTCSHLHPSDWKQATDDTGWLRIGIFCTTWYWSVILLVLIIRSRLSAGLQTRATHHK